MTITICGSLSHYKKGVQVKNKLQKQGHTVLWPWGMQERAEGRLLQKDLNKFKSANQGKAIKVHYEKIKKADAVLIVNEDKNGIKNYIGGNTLMEMGFAYVLGKPIYLLNPIPEKISWSEEIVAMKPVVLKENLKLVR